MLPKTYGLIKDLLNQAKEDAVRKALREIDKDFVALSREINTLRKENSEMTNRNKELEAKLLEYERWDQIAEKYSLAELAPGVFVYKVKPVVQGEDPGHCLCTKCFQEKKRFPLNRTGRDTSGVHYTCPNCGTKFTDHTQAVDIPPPVIE